MLIDFILFLNLLNSSIAQYLNIPIKYLSHELILKTALSSSKIQKDFIISLSSDFTFITSFHFKLSSSPTSMLISRANSFLYKNKYIELDLYRETLLLFKLNKTTSSSISIEFPYFHTGNNENSTIREYDFIGLSRTFADLRLSLVHQLYRYNYINKLSFTGTPTRLYLGTIPDSMINNGKTNTTTCKNDISQNTTGWSCKLNAVKLFNYTYPTIEQYSVLDIKDEDILVPLVIWNNIHLNYFEKRITQGVCRYSLSGYSFRYICNESVVNSIDDIQLMFDGFDIIIKNNVLFDVYTMGNYALKLRLNEENCKEWRFGKIVLSRFNMTFDYEMDEIKIGNSQESTEVLLYSTNGRAGDGKGGLKGVKNRVDVCGLVLGGGGCIFEFGVWYYFRTGKNRCEIDIK